MGLSGHVDSAHAAEQHGALQAKPGDELHAPCSRTTHCRWLDSSPGIPGQLYLHWGVPRGGVPEPNGNSGDQTCVIGYYTLSYQNLWGWADEDCEVPATAMCEVPRK